LNKSGVYNVEKMRTIQLFVAQFNMNNKSQAETSCFEQSHWVPFQKNKQALASIIDLFFPP
jgi:hypothetical protein